jgi:hypothetical protein
MTHFLPLLVQISAYIFCLDLPSSNKDNIPEDITAIAIGHRQTPSAHGPDFTSLTGRRPLTVLAGKKTIIVFS